MGHRFDDFRAGKCVRVPHPLRFSKGGGLDLDQSKCAHLRRSQDVQVDRLKIRTLAKTARMGHPAPGGAIQIENKRINFLQRRLSTWKAIRPTVRKLDLGSS